MLVEEELQRLVGEIDADLLKAVLLEVLEPEDVEQAYGREVGTSLDRKKPPASKKHGDYVEYSTRRVWGGTELRNTREKVPK